MRKISSAAVVAAVSAAVLTLTGCGSPPAPAAAPAAAPAPSSGVTALPHNDADVVFAQMMIPHHQQGVDMAGMADAQASSAQLKQLAVRIQQEQTGEMGTLRDFLEAWNAPEASTGSMQSGSMQSGSMQSGSMQGAMPATGMADDQQMQQLGQLHGPDFDTQFLHLMITHHQGAVQMAKTELAGGANPDAKTLAQKIIDTQQAEIQQMRSMLAGG